MSRVAPVLGDDVRRYAWHLSFDSDAIRIDKVRRMLDAVYPNSGHNFRYSGPGRSERAGLTRFWKSTRPSAAALRTFLLMLSLPVLLSLLLYTLISSEIMVAADEGEIVTLRSRGASSLQIVWLYFLEMLVIGRLELGRWVNRGGRRHARDGSSLPLPDLRDATSFESLFFLAGCLCTRARPDS